MSNVVDLGAYKATLDKCDVFTSPMDEFGTAVMIDFGKHYIWALVSKERAKELSASLKARCLTAIGDFVKYVEDTGCIAISGASPENEVFTIRDVQKMRKKALKRLRAAQRYA